MDGRNLWGRSARSSPIISLFSWIVDAITLPPSFSKSFVVCVVTPAVPAAGSALGLDKCGAQQAAW